MTHELEAAKQVEHALLACLIENSALISQIDFDLAHDLLLSDHQALWHAMVELHDESIELSDRVLLAERAKVDITVIADLLASGAIAENFPTYLQRTRELARARRIRHYGEELKTASPTDFPRIIEQLQEQATELSRKSVRRFQDIPEIQILDIPAADYIVPALGIARNTITLWTGEDGSGKTILAYAMSAAVAQGQEFLGMSCQQCPVLYLDLENPAYVVQGRVRAILGHQSVPQLRVWGTWDEVQAPQYGNPELLKICKDSHPLVVVDPFRYFHDRDEDSSTAMAPVMKYLRACAAFGGAVVILHHPAKTENSKGRGSSAIRAACDLAFLHKLDKEKNIITLRVDKNRNGERRDLRIEADFEEGCFELSESVWLKHRDDDIRKLKELISKEPGIHSNQLAAKVGGRKERVLKLLEQGAGTHWIRQEGPKGSKIFFPIEGTGSWFPSKEGGTREPVAECPFGSGNQWEPVGTGNQ